MNIRHVKGKRIVGVRQSYMLTGYGRAVNVHAIILDDGSELRPITIEEKDAAFYGTQLIHWRPKNEKQRTP